MSQIAEFQVRCLPAGNGDCLVVTAFIFNIFNECAIDG